MLRLAHTDADTVCHQRLVKVAHQYPPLLQLLLELSRRTL